MVGFVCPDWTFLKFLAEVIWVVVKSMVLFWVP